MPRLLAGGPGIAVSPDSAWIAVAGGGRLSLLDAATRAEAQATHLPGGEIDLVFVRSVAGERVLAFHRRDQVTDVRSYALPQLELSGALELTGLVRPRAVVGDRVLVYDDAGEHPRTLTVAPKVVTADPIALREPVQLATAAPEGLLVAARDQFECWDPVARRAMFRLNLPVARPLRAGFAAKRRLLWVATAGPVGALDVYRFSDGRQLLHVDLGKRFVAADGRADSGRLVVAAREENRPLELTELDLQQQQRRVIAADVQAASFGVVEGTAPAVVLVDGDLRVKYLPLDAHADGERQRPARNATPPIGVRIEGGETRTVPLANASWRARLGGAPEERAHAAPPPVAAPAPSGAVALAPPIVPLEAQPEPEAARAPLVAPASFRDGLVAWAEQALKATESAPAPPVAGTPVAALAARLALPEPAQVALALIYAARLRGEPAVPAQVVAQATARVMKRPASEEIWAEALGQGALGRAGIARARGGRVRLAEVAGRVLDGAPAHMTLVTPPDGAAPKESPAGTHRVALEGERVACAQALAARLGRPVAIVDAGARLGPRLVEARLRGAVPLLVGGEGQPEAWLAQLERLDGALALVGVRGTPPAALAHLPVFG